MSRHVHHRPHLRRHPMRRLRSSIHSRCSKDHQSDDICHNMFKVHIGCLRHCKDNISPPTTQPHRPVLYPRRKIGHFLCKDYVIPCCPALVVFCNVLALRWLSLDRRVFFDYLSSFNVLIDSLLRNTLGGCILQVVDIQRFTGLSCLPGHAGQMHIAQIVNELGGTLCGVSLVGNTLCGTLLVMVFIEGENGNKKRVTVV